jgi:hypothetical protein
VPGFIRARAVTRHQVRQYLGKAEEFLAVAEDCLAAGRTTAATGNAIHAAVNAGDVVCGALTGERAAGPDHRQAVTLLNRCGPPGPEVATCLGRLLPLKTKAEYEPADVPRGAAEKAVEWARRSVALAGDLVAGMGADR